MDNQIFTPSSTALLDMIRSAEARFDADREQAALRREAQAEARAVKAWVAEAEAKRRRQLWA